MTGTLEEDLRLHLGEQNILVEISFAARHELTGTGAQTIVPTPTLVVLKGGVVSTNLTVGSIVLDPTSKIVQFKVTVGAGAADDDVYEIKCTATLSGGSVLVECLGVTIIPC